MGIISATLIAGIIGWFYKKGKPNIEDFDKIVEETGDPVLIEQKLTELLPQAQKLSNNSVYVQILSQIALFQAVQKKFEQAHQTIDQAELQVLSTDYIAQTRILLERGRIFQQVGDFEQALHYFKKSYELSLEHHFDYHTINAAHMIAIVVPTVQEKIAWNELALVMALKTKDKKASSWLAFLYNNLGQNYFDIQDYEKSMEMYQKALILFGQMKKVANLRFARWTIARCLRALGRFDEALVIQKQLLKECKDIETTGFYDMPIEMFLLTRGWIYEELAEIYNVQDSFEEAENCVNLALVDLESNEMFAISSADRLERLRNMRKL